MLWAAKNRDGEAALPTARAYSGHNQLSIEPGTTPRVLDLSSSLTDSLRALRVTPELKLMAHLVPNPWWINCSPSQISGQSLYCPTLDGPWKCVHLFTHSIHHWWITFYIMDTGQETGDELVSKPVCGVALQVVWWGIILIVTLNTDSKVAAEHSGGTKSIPSWSLPLLSSSYHLWVLKAEWSWRPHVRVKALFCGFPFQVIEFEYPHQTKGPPDPHCIIAGSKQLSRWNCRECLLFIGILNFSLGTDESGQGLLAIAAVHPKGEDWIRKLFSVSLHQGLLPFSHILPSVTSNGNVSISKTDWIERGVLPSGPCSWKNGPWHSERYA